MNMYGATSSIILMLFIFLFGSRDAAFEKDFVYFNPHYKLRRLLYVRNVPSGEITFSSITMQCLIIVTVTFQILSLLGTDILKPLIEVLRFGRYTFPHADNPYFQTIFCVTCIFFPGAIFEVVYILVCARFATKK
jgi:hypothetical protein